MPKEELIYKKYYIDRKEVMKITGRKNSAASKLIKELNDKFKGLGYTTITGKVPRKFFFEQMGLEEE